VSFLEGLDFWKKSPVILVCTKEYAVEKDTRVIVAFALNFVLPGSGICFSGLVHRMRWLLCVGLGFITPYLLSGAMRANLASLKLYTLLTSPSFDVLDSLLFLALGFFIALLGAVVESDITEKKS